MAFGAFNPQREQSMMSDINVTPMVDVMLVLLVIFIITAPMLTSALKLDLPQAAAAPASQGPDSVQVGIDADGVLHWGKEKVSAQELDARLAQAARRAPRPEVQLHADKNTRYETVARVMAAAQASGLTRIGFVTEQFKEKPHGQR